MGACPEYSNKSKVPVVLQVRELPYPHPPLFAPPLNSATRTGDTGVGGRAWGILDIGTPQTTCPAGPMAMGAMAA